MQGKYEGSKSITYKIEPARVNITTIKTKVSSFEVNFTESETADGYEAEYSLNEDFSESVALQTDTTKFLAENLPQNSTFYIRVRACKKVGDETLYSAWSETKKCSLKEITVKDGMTYIDGILVVNKTYSLPEDYGSGEDPEALAAFQEMCSAAANDGIYLFSVSGYRSYDLQNYLYNEFKDQRGTEGADMVSARPGHSEHQSGLAFDVNTTSFAFIGTPEAQWLAENSYRYGFIIRYPEGKEDITGYSYEPWHIRYVGKEFAETIYKSGLTLEEYFGITSEYKE
ncbi:MAG: M15 family metallopeptidase [Clostridia bacterium]|nr:M15 family metallopeptidase [Clostridia bacterium]